MARLTKGHIMPHHTKLDSRITTKAPYGQHISLTCANHPELSWSTKNIGNANEDGTGVYFARHIYFDGCTECTCPPSDLIVNPKLMAMEDVPS